MIGLLVAKDDRRTAVVTVLLVVACCSFVMDRAVQEMYVYSSRNASHLVLLQIKHGCVSVYTFDTILLFHYRAVK